MNRSEKKDKRINNKKLRRKVRNIIIGFSYDMENGKLLPIMKEVSDRWNMNKDRA